MRCIIQRKSDGKYLAMACRGYHWVDEEVESYAFPTQKAAEAHWQMQKDLGVKSYVNDEPIFIRINGEI